MNGCGKCSGNCAGCSGCTGCGGAIELTEGEVKLLTVLGQIPFLPVARPMGEDTPVYLEDNAYSPGEYSRILQCLEKRGLISIDYDKPLKGWNSQAYEAYPIRGSFALTARGQRVLELMEVQGME